MPGPSLLWMIWLRIQEEPPEYYRHPCGKMGHSGKGPGEARREQKGGEASGTGNALMSLPQGCAVVEMTPTTVFGLKDLVWPPTR